MPTIRCSRCGREDDADVADVHYCDAGRSALQARGGACLSPQAALGGGRVHMRVIRLS
jgi:hypothetical protein